MRIYTKTGDNGTTALFGGRRVSKDDAQVSAYGTIDELSSFLGLLLIKKITVSDKQLLMRIQKDLYQIMAFLSGAHVDLDFLKTSTREIENRIDELETKLPALTQFILPQGSEVAVFFHVVRTICRRAERKIIGYIHSNTTRKKPSVMRFVNRLSDLFFVMARYYNKEKEISV